eukprot:Gb_21995 [translate_table: standard]
MEGQQSFTRAEFRGLCSHASLAGKAAGFRRFAPALNGPTRCTSPRISSRLLSWHGKSALCGGGKTGTRHAPAMVWPCMAYDGNREIELFYASLFAAWKIREAILIGHSTKVDLRTGAMKNAAAALSSRPPERESWTKRFRAGNRQDCHRQWPNTQAAVSVSDNDSWPDCSTSATVCDIHGNFTRITTPGENSATSSLLSSCDYWEPAVNPLENSIQQAFNWDSVPTSSSDGLLFNLQSTRSSDETGIPDLRAALLASNSQRFAQSKLMPAIAGFTSTDGTKGEGFDKQNLYIQQQNAPMDHSGNGQTLHNRTNMAWSCGNTTSVNFHPGFNANMTETVKREEFARFLNSRSRKVRFEEFNVNMDTDSSVALKHQPSGLKSDSFRIGNSSAVINQEEVARSNRVSSIVSQAIAAKPTLHSSNILTFNSDMNKSDLANYPGHKTNVQRQNSANDVHDSGSFSTGDNLQQKTTKQTDGNEDSATDEKRTSFSLESDDQYAVKKLRTSDVSRSGPLKAQARKEKLGERITALQQIVSPFGKTDTSSVLLEAIGYIKFLQDQVQVLSTPYLKGVPSGVPEGRGESHKYDLQSRGLCLVPVACTQHIANNNGADFWTSGIGSGLICDDAAYPTRFPWQTPFIKILAALKKLRIEQVSINKRCRWRRATEGKVYGDKDTNQVIFAKVTRRQFAIFALCAKHGQHCFLPLTQ